VVSWVSEQVPDGTDWIEYMMVYTPEKTGLPPSVTPGSLGSMDHFSLGVPDIKKLSETLYFGDRLPQKNSGRSSAAMASGSTTCSIRMAPARRRWSFNRWASPAAQSSPHRPYKIERMSFCNRRPVRTLAPAVFSSAP